jgi:TatD DNase family protein
MLIDTHCHIDQDRFDDDRPDALARARAAGVARMVNVGCDLSSSARSLGLACTHPDVWATVGIHPHEAKDAGDFDDSLFMQASHHRCVAVGECGLDYHYNHSVRDTQRDVFARQIAVARKAAKPLVLHIRSGSGGDAFAESLDILRSEKASDIGGVFHCFTGNVAQARAALDIGFYLSLPGVVTFSQNGELSDVARMAPADRVVVETDSPFLAPVPCRGKRNEPAFVQHTARFVADVRGMSYEDFVHQTGQNALQLFWRARPEA